MKVRPGFIEDKALSDVVGTMLLLGVTVTIVVAATAAYRGFSATGSSEKAPAVLDVGLLAKPNNATITLVHLGGDSLTRSAIRILVDVNHTRVLSAIMSASGGTTWKVGDRVGITLPTAPPPTSRVTVHLITVPQGAAIATAEVSLPSIASRVGLSLSGFTITAGFGGASSDAVVNTSTTVHLYALVSHPEGRKAIRDVIADLSGVAGPTYVPMTDDGTNGDPVAGDGNYSLFFTVPTFVPLGTKTISIAAYSMDDMLSNSNANISIIVSRTDRLAYNSTLMGNVGIWVGKYGIDKISARLKIDARTSNITVNGTKLYPKRAVLSFLPYKHNDAGFAGPIGFLCQNNTNNITAWYWSNLTITNFDSRHNAFQYFFEIEWSNAAVPAVTRTELVEAANRDGQYLTLKTNEQQDILGWTGTNYANCNP